VRKFLRWCLLLSVFTMVTPSASAQSPSAQASSLYDIEVVSIDGAKVPLRKYEGTVLLFVNVASQCGFTRQYEGLQRLYEQYKDKGFTVLGFPSNDFGGQEPGTEAEIKAFCSNTFGVSFPMFSKVAVLGAARHPVYQFLTSATGGADVRWNFEKFLVDRKGGVVARFGSSTTPSDAELVTALEKALSAPAVAK
jgi:glutathione peroxidase